MPFKHTKKSEILVLMLPWQQRDSVKNVKSYVAYKKLKRNIKPQMTKESNRNNKIPSPSNMTLKDTGSNVMKLNKRIFNIC